MIAFQDPDRDLLRQLPVKASTFTDDVDGVYYLSLWICAFFFFLILGILIYAVFKYRRRTPDQPPASMTTHNTALEVAWTLIPLVIVMILFAWGWKGVRDMTVAPADALQYEAVGQQWEWQISHPGSKSPVINEMWVPYGKNVKVTMFSNDVLHSFYIPAFRVKRDVLPGRKQMVWFNANRLSEMDPETGQPIGYPLLCAEYCGTNHSYMLGKVYVVSQELYDTRPWEILPTDPIELGKYIYDRRCYTCHTIDGAKSTAPTFKGLWGKNEQLADGSTVLVDADYIRESIQNPNAKRVAGYDGVNMTLFPDITDEQIDGIIEYIKTLQ